MSNSNHLTDLCVTEMRKGLLRREFSSKELVEAHLTLIEKTNESLNSFITICREDALLSAAWADQRLAKEKDAAPILTGIPVAIKDILITLGVETTCGSKMLKGFVPPYDCTAVAKLKKNSAIIVGKTNLDEFAMGSSNESSAFGPVRNPWDLERVPGGSSGGSAAAVASGQAPLALGTDTGGSIRQPAAFTGTYGLKPTYGRVSRYGAVACASSLDQIGGFARSVEDLAVMLTAIAGKDPFDSTSMDVPVPDYLHELQSSVGQGLSGLRIGVPKEYFTSGMQPEVERLCRESLKVLSSLGAKIVDISLPHTEYALATYYIIMPAEASSNMARYDGVRYGFRAEDGETLEEMYAKSRALGLGKEVQRRIMIGSYVLSAGYFDAYYLKAQQVRTLIVEDFSRAFNERCDIIAAPVSPMTAFRLGEKFESPLEMYLADIFTAPVNLAGLPALSMPCGLDITGLPVGIQLIAPAFEEQRLLLAAEEFSRERAFDVRTLLKKKEQ